jgi:hypothetical protein
MRWFRPAGSPHQTALAMIGAKAGDRVLILGAGNPALAAELGRVTGLNGRTLVVDPDAKAGPAIETAAAGAGALVDFERQDLNHLAIARDGWTVAVTMLALGALPADQRVACLTELLGQLEPGGRLIVIESARKNRTASRAPTAPPLPSADVLALLQHVNGRACRLLADIGGSAFYEAQRARA